MKIENRLIAALNQEIEFKIGQNANDNFDIIDSSNPSDLWFHLSGESSSHVIASLPFNQKLDKKQKRQIITQGALLCKQHSKHKSLPKTNIIYTEIKNIEKTNIPGSVNVTNQKTISI